MPDARVAAMPPIVASAPGSTEKWTPLFGKRLVQLAMRDASFDLTVEIFDADAQNAVHARQIDRNATVDGIDVPLERGTDAEGNDRRTMRASRSARSQTPPRWSAETRRRPAEPGACHDSPWLWCSICVGFVLQRSPSSSRRSAIAAARACSVRVDAISDVLSVLFKGQRYVVSGFSRTRQRSHAVPVHH